jgi:hypothetical protein
MPWDAIEIESLIAVKGRPLGNGRGPLSRTSDAALDECAGFGWAK